MQTIEQLREQQKQIQTQLEEAERLQREQREREREQAAQRAHEEQLRLKEHAKRGISQGIADELSKQFPGTKVTFEEGITWPRFYIDGVQADAFTVSYTAQRAHDRYKQETGKYYVVVETGVYHTPEWQAQQRRSYGSMRHGRRHPNSIKRFPPRKDGTHAYEAIGAWIAQLIMKKREQEASAEIAKVNKTRSMSIAEQLIEQFGGAEELRKARIRIEPIVSESDKVHITFSGAFTAEEAVRVVTALATTLANS